VHRRPLVELGQLLQSRGHQVAWTNLAAMAWKTFLLLDPIRSNSRIGWECLRIEPGSKIELIRNSELMENRSLMSQSKTVSLSSIDLSQYS